jgi:hypothetical protein
MLPRARARGHGGRLAVVRRTHRVCGSRATDPAGRETSVGRAIVDVEGPPRGSPGRRVVAISACKRGRFCSSLNTGTTMESVGVTGDIGLDSARRAPAVPGAGGRKLSTSRLGTLHPTLRRPIRQGRTAGRLRTSWPYEKPAVATSDARRTRRKEPQRTQREEVREASRPSRWFAPPQRDRDATAGTENENKKSGGRTRRTRR